MYIQYDKADRSVFRNFTLDNPYQLLYIILSPVVPCKNFNNVGCALVNAAVEESLESLGPYIRSLNHTDFKIHVNALRAAKVI